MNIQIKSVSLQIDENNWNKIVLNNSVLIVPKHMKECSFFDDFEDIRKKGLPYIYFYYENKNINYIELSTGIIRAVPIFYTIYNNRLFISDFPETLEKMTYKRNLDINSILEFLSFGYVLKERTLLEGINEIQAGEKLIYENGEIKLIDEYIYDNSEIDDISREEAFKKLEKVLYDTFEMYYKKLKNKKLVVPLSGGYDSRLIVSMFKEFGLKDVLCVSYGLKNNFESTTAQKVAKNLGYQFKFVEYNPHKIANLCDNEKYINFLEFGSRKVSVAHIQEFLMIEKLKNELDKINKEIVIVPGHAADFVAGSHIPYKLLREVDLDIIVKTIFAKYYYRNCCYNKNVYKNMINYIKYIMRIQSEPYKILEIKVWRERQAKFIANANRIYEYNNYYWAMPFWYKDFVEFWSKMPLKYKYQKNLYDEYLEEVLFKKYKINFDKEKRQKKRNENNNKLYVTIKDILKRNNFIRNLYIKLASNPLGFHEIGNEILDFANKDYSQGFQFTQNIIKENFKGESKEINSYCAEYYLSKLFDERGF
jgi:asparagine synthase (glutamine-hydrolysing)